MRTSNQHTYFKVICNGVQSIVLASSAKSAADLAAKMEITVDPATPEDIEAHIRAGGAILKQPAPTGAKRGPKPGTRRAVHEVSAKSESHSAVQSDFVQQSATHLGVAA